MLGLDYTSKGKFLTSAGLTLVFLAFVLFFSYNVFLIERLERYNEKFVPGANTTEDTFRNKNEDALLNVVNYNIKLCQLFVYVLLFGGFILLIFGLYIWWWREEKDRKIKNFFNLYHQHKLI